MISQQSEYNASCLQMCPLPSVSIRFCRLLVTLMHINVFISEYRMVLLTFCPSLAGIVWHTLSKCESGKHSDRQEVAPGYPGWSWAHSVSGRGRQEVRVLGAVGKKHRSQRASEGPGRRSAGGGGSKSMGASQSLEEDPALPTPHGAGMLIFYL